jgi:adenine deaminase
VVQRKRKAFRTWEQKSRTVPVLFRRKKNSCLNNPPVNHCSSKLRLAGLPAFEVLRTATLYPAQYFKAESRYGSIKAGKVADLVILNANPVTSIGHTRNISAVFLDGRYITGTQVKALISRTNKLSNGILVSAKLIWAMLLNMTI